MKKVCLHWIRAKKSASEDSIPGWRECARTVENEFHFQDGGAILITRNLFLFVADVSCPVPVSSRPF
jgi:hypothetical protein